MKRRREDDGENRAGSSGRNEAGCSDSKLDDDGPEVRPPLVVPKPSKDVLAKSIDPPSNDGVDTRYDACASDSKSEPKHEIFLSHSGKQKGFTELLEKELVRCGYSPFFDIRNDCLPKGKWFPELIFSAGRQCCVAVLILSEDFFNSKWPMLELATFVDAQKERRKQKLPPLDILPVYYKLTRDECRMDENLQRWQKRWEELEISDLAKELNAVKISEMDKMLNKKDERTGPSILDEGERADIHARMQSWYLEAIRERDICALQWKDAMKVLGPANGINMPSLREAELIDEVVKAVRGLLPPPTMSSDPGIKAKRRICESLKEMISTTKASPNGARVVGVYGMGGMGKTTFCKEMCVEYFKDFEGKVCHAELGSLSRSELQKKDLRMEVLRKLTDVNHSSLLLAEDSKVTDYVRTRMVGEMVFLALDDVWPESKGEAMVYVEQAQYGHGSIVMVTARTIDVLRSLGIRSCFAMPELDVEDAMLLFLHHASPNFLSQGGEDEECIRHCVHECYFSRGEEGGSHFLPLALKVLGESMHGMGENPREWVESLSMDDKFDMYRRKEHPLYFILGRGYASLRPEDQLLFMDIVLCNPGWARVSLYPTVGSLYEWLSIVHYNTALEVSSIRNRLLMLKEKALLEDIGDGRSGVIVHDLYCDFAKFEASRVDLDARRVVWHDEVTDLPMDLVKKPSGNCWSSVERVGVSGGLSGSVVVDGVKWKHFANVVVLVIMSDDVGKELDLQELQCLRSMVVRTKEFKISGLGEMRNLVWLELKGVCCGPDFEEEISRLTKLQMLGVEAWCTWGGFTYPVIKSCAIQGSRLNLKKCINLRELVVHCTHLQALPDLAGMKSLRKVEFSCQFAIESFGGLVSQVYSPQEFCLSSLHDRLPRLHEVVPLQILDVNGLYKLEVFPAIGVLTRLRILRICNLPKILLVPGLGELVALEKLVLRNLPKVRELPDMRLLTKLQSMRLDGVGEVWEQLQLLDMIPSQLRYFAYAGSKCCELISENTYKTTFYGKCLILDLHNLDLGGTVLRDILPQFPNWCIPKML